MRIHLTGGVGAGKSSVLRFLEEEYGAKILRADDLAKELMEPGEEGYRRVVELLGKDILAADGTIDRAAMAERIYHDDSARAGVNAIIHPREDVTVPICGSLKDSCIYQFLLRAEIK